MSIYTSDLYYTEEEISVPYKGDAASYLYIEQGGSFYSLFGIRMNLVSNIVMGKIRDPFNQYPASKIFQNRYGIFLYSTSPVQKVNHEYLRLKKMRTARFGFGTMDNFEAVKHLTNYYLHFQFYFDTDWGKLKVQLGEADPQKPSRLQGKKREMFGFFSNSKRQSEITMDYEFCHKTFSHPVKFAHIIEQIQRGLYGH